MGIAEKQHIIVRKSTVHFLGQNHTRLFAATWKFYEDSSKQKDFVLLPNLYMHFAQM